MAAVATGSRIVASGCTSGLGLEAVKQLLRTTPASLPPPYHLVLLARDANAQHALRARDELQAMAAALSTDVRSDVELRSADLGDLHSCRTAAKGILGDLTASPSASPATSSSSSSSSWQSISAGQIDLLLLNAAVAKGRKELVQDADHENDETESGPLIDAQGRYEQTACVNHVAPQLLASMLIPHMISTNSPTSGGSHVTPVPRVVFTGSALHRKLKSQEDLSFYFDPRRSVDAETGPQRWDLAKSYGASKFLQMVGVQRLIQRLQEQLRGVTDAKIEIVVVQPGFIPQTGLNRETPLIGRVLLRYVFPWLPLPFVATVREGAENIADACHRPLKTFPARETVAGNAAPSAPSAWLEEACTAVDGVRKALVVRGGLRETPDERTGDAELQARWWPACVDQQWRQWQQER